MEEFKEKINKKVRIYIIYEYFNVLLLFFNDFNVDTFSFEINESFKRKIFWYTILKQEQGLFNENIHMNFIQKFKNNLNKLN